MNREKKSYLKNKGFSAMVGFACISTTVLAGVAVLLMHKREWDIRSTPYYKETMKLWQENESAKYIIGEPISLKPVEKLDPRNHISDKKAKFYIPFTGQNYNGKMNVNATCEDEKWTLHELNFELDRDLADKKFIIYRQKMATNGV